MSTGIEQDPFTLTPAEPGGIHDTHTGAPDLMSNAEFCVTDWTTSTPPERMRYMLAKVRMVRDRNEGGAERAYYDGIESAYMASFDTVTPEVLADPSRMNFIRCVDPYEDEALDASRFGDDEQIRLPGGLGWLDVTGLTPDWVVPRIFNEELVVGIHKNCGGFAILGARTGERQAMHRDRAVEGVQRAVAETAAQVRAAYFRGRRKIDPDAAELLTTFGGPKLRIATGPIGTAERFVTPKTVSTAAVDVHYRPSELVANVDRWVERRFAARVQE